MIKIKKSDCRFMYSSHLNKLLNDDYFGFILREESATGKHKFLHAKPATYIPKDVDLSSCFTNSDLIYTGSIHSLLVPLLPTQKDNGVCITFDMIDSLDWNPYNQCVSNHRKRLSLKLLNGLMQSSKLPLGLIINPNSSYKPLGHVVNRNGSNVMYCVINNTISPITKSTYSVVSATEPIDNCEVVSYQSGKTIDKMEFDVSLQDVLYSGSFKECKIWVKNNKQEGLKILIKKKGL